MFEEKETGIDMAEIWRQNYEDALDEIRNLRYEINKLKIENEDLRKIEYQYNENSAVDFLG